jgi:hypothetical protein
MHSNVKSLKRALTKLILFLDKMAAQHWVGVLKGILEQLNNPTTIEIGRHKLESCFGGMGSLNDLFFSEANGNLPPGFSEDKVNIEFNRLMDAVFRENRLASASLRDRLLWRYYEFKYQDELPPRIKKTFAR